MWRGKERIIIREKRERRRYGNIYKKIVKGRRDTEKKKEEIKKNEKETRKKKNRERMWKEQEKEQKT